MAFYWKRIVIFLVLVIAVLQVIHMVLLSRLEVKRSERRKTLFHKKNDKYALQYNKYTELEVEEDRKRMHLMVQESTVLDASGQYHIINFFKRASSLGSRNHVRQDLSIITQTSISQLYHLEDIVNRWNGLISVAIFALKNDLLDTIELILHLCQCNSAIRFNTSFHLVYPLSAPLPPIGATTSPPHPSIEYLIKKHNCDNISLIIQSFQPGVINYAHNGVAYPNNLLRNVARRNCLTEYMFTIDIDLVPNNNLRKQFIEFAKENNLFTDTESELKTVFVVPAYEVNVEKIPIDKANLLRMIQMNEARPFYAELCWKCQKYTDYDLWQREPPRTKLNVLFEVLWRDPWEPFYISRNSVPLYDERFRQYGFNRISQVGI